MKIRAVILDIYNTLLEIGPPPADAETRWAGLWRECFGVAPRMPEKEFRQRAETAIARDHAKARAAGVAHPEIYWPNIVSKLIPELSALNAARRDTVLFEHAGLQRTTRLTAGAGEALSEMHRRGRLRRRVRHQALLAQARQPRLNS